MHSEDEARQLREVIGHLGGDVASYEVRGHTVIMLRQVEIDHTTRVSHLQCSCGAEQVWLDQLEVHGPDDDHYEMVPQFAAMDALHRAVLAFGPDTVGEPKANSHRRLRHAELS